MRFTSIFAILAAAVSAAPAISAQQASDSAAIAANVQKLEALFAASPAIDASLASKFPALAKDGKVDTKVLASLPGDLIDTGVDLVLSVPEVLVDTAGSLLQIPGNLLSFVGDILTGNVYDDED